MALRLAVSVAVLAHAASGPAGPVPVAASALRGSGSVVGVLGAVCAGVVLETFCVVLGTAAGLLLGWAGLRRDPKERRRAAALSPGGPARTGGEGPGRAAARLGALVLEEAAWRCVVLPRALLWRTPLHGVVAAAVAWALAASVPLVAARRPAGDVAAAALGAGLSSVRLGWLALSGGLCAWPSAVARWAGGRAARTVLGPDGLVEGEPYLAGPRGLAVALGGAPGAALALAGLERAARLRSA